MPADTDRPLFRGLPRFALAACALLPVAACADGSRDGARQEWVYTGPPSPRRQAALRAEQREIERAAALAARPDR